MIIKRRKKRKGFWFELLDAVISAALIALVIKSMFIETAKIPSSSMEDSLLIADQLFVDKFLYGVSIPFTKIKFHIMEKRSPKRNEIVVFIPPTYAKSDKPLFVKRCLGVPGDKLYMKDNVLFRNGEKIEEDYLKLDRGKRGYFKNWPFPENSPYYTANNADFSKGEHILPGSWPENGSEYTVPEDYYFMMGDHRTDSYDSRFWGPVHIREVIGIVRFRWFPFDRIGFIN